MSTLSNNPWHGLSVPESASNITARRVDPTNKWDLFWAVDHERRVLLVMKHEVKNMPKTRLPKLREIEVRSEVLPGGQPILVLRLLTSSAKDLFYLLCTDIAEATTRCASEAAAVETAVARTWRWHHLLKGGSSGLLSPRAQVGLIGELLVLETYLIPLAGPDLAVNGWLGPLDAPQDFRLGRVGIESKATSSENAGSVRISSEFQLDSSEVDALFLHICQVESAAPEDHDALCLTDHVQRLRVQLVDAGSAVQERFNALLVAAGYSNDDDYSSFTWNASERSVFRVDAEFPRLTPSTIPAGVGRLTYSVDVRLIGSLLVSPETFRETLAGGIQ